jgi:hypothetical protein
LIIVGVRTLRIPGVYQGIGVTLFIMIAIAAWIQGTRLIKFGTELAQSIALSGTLLLVPLAIISLMWVGLATPWDATASENQMRYAVLLVGSIAVTIAFIILKEALNDVGERFYSTFGFAANVLAGSAYLIWLSFQLGAHTAKLSKTNCLQK